MKIFVIYILSLLIVSCATTNMATNPVSPYVVQVDSYGEDSILTIKNCFLYVADSTINTSDLQFVELYGYVSKSLSSKGYQIVDSIESANIVILFNYGISDANTQDYMRSIPIWGQTGISSKTTTGNVYVNPYSNSVSYNQNTSTTPTYGVVGYRQVQESVTTYRRYLNLVAYDYEYFKKSNKEKRIWQTVITSNGSSGDLRKVFPYMLAASKKYIGHSSGQKIELKINQDDQEAILLKGQ
jgi:hypothetical protein